MVLKSSKNSNILKLLDEDYDSNSHQEHSESNEDSDQHDEQQTFVETQKEKLQLLSLLGKQVSLNIQIQYINFMHKYGTSNKSLKKKIKIRKQDETFIKFIKSLEDKKQQIIEHVKNNTQISNPQIQQLVSQYNQYYEQKTQQTHQFDLLMLYALKHIKNSHNLQSQITRIIQTKQRPIEISTNMAIEQKKNLETQSKGLTQIQQEIFLINQILKDQSHHLEIDTLDNLTKEQVSPLLTSSVQSNSSLYSSVVRIDQSILSDMTTADFYNQEDNDSNKQKQRLNLFANEGQNFKKNKTSQMNLSFKPPLCCRRFFYENQIIVKSHLQQSFPIKPPTNHSKIPQNNIYLSVDSSIQFQDEEFPFSEYSLEIFENQLCAFLNGVGGTIFIGICKSKTNSQQYVVKGLDISEGQKQAIIRHFRVIGSKIEPDIVTHKLYSVDFVPLKNERSNNFIAGAYVVQIRVKHGNRDEVYCIKNKDSYFDKFVFRQNNSQNQIIQGRRLLDIVKDRYENPLKVPQLLHPGTCQRPEIGLVINEYYDDQWNAKKNNSYDYDTYDSEYENKNKKLFKEKPETQIHKKIISQTHIKNHSPLKPSANSSPSKPVVVHYDKQEQQYHHNKSDYFQATEIASIPKNNHSSQAYFYVVGLNEKMLKPVLIQKEVYNAVIQQADQNLKLVVKAFDNESILKIRKILKKIESKYKDRNIRFYQLSLKIRVLKFKEALIFLKKTTFKYEADECKRELKFQFFKESLFSWLYLKEQGIQGDFIH